LCIVPSDDATTVQAAIPPQLKPASDLIPRSRILRTSAARQRSAPLLHDR
jgi:hypothetical protein